MLKFNQEGLLGRGIFNLAPRQLGLIQTVSVVVVKQPLEKWYFVSKIVLTYCEKKIVHFIEKNLKFEAEG